MSKKGSITTSDYLPFEEYKRLLECLENEGKYEWCMYCILSFAFGLRVSDVLRIRWEKVYEQIKITVTEKKTGKTKSIPIGQNTQDKINELYVKMGSPSLKKLVMESQYNEGRPISRQYINRLLKKWKVKYNLNVGNISTHTFRKTFGHYVYEKLGKTEEAIVYLNLIFKHHSLKTTMAYIGIRNEEINQIFTSISI